MDGSELLVVEKFAFVQQLQPVFSQRSSLQRESQLAVKARARLGFLCGFDEGSDARACREQLFAHHVFALLFEVFIKTHDAQGELI